MKLNTIILCCLLITTLVSEKIEYLFKDDPIDVVIPCIEKDVETLDLCIAGVRANVKNVRRVIVVSPERYTDQAEWYDEKEYPFSKFDLGYYILHKNRENSERFLAKCLKVGWIYQQFLKLYAPLVIPNISTNVLIVDADLIFYRPVEFLGKSNAGLYNPATEYNEIYFKHMARLIPGLTRYSPIFSGIAHHMLFQRCVIEDLFSTIEAYHKVPTWQALCQCIDPDEIQDNCMSEYEIYFNFVFSRTTQVKIRPLIWANKGDFSEPTRKADYKKGYDYVAYHSYNREEVAPTKNK